MSGTPPRDWDALAYEQVDGPQRAMAGPVLDRLAPAGHETVLDAGCGPGAVTEMLLERLPRGRVIGVDGSAAMLERSRARLGDRVELHHADLAALDLPGLEVDAVFSNAVFHWVGDHDALFARLFAHLRPGGRLCAQCGGEGNIESFHEVARDVASVDPYAEAFGGWVGPWNFAGPDQTAARLRAAGFEDIHTWLEGWPVTPPEPGVYIATVCLGAHLEQLPHELREAFVADVLEQAGDPLRLEYVRLNMTASRPLLPA